MIGDPEVMDRLARRIFVAACVQGRAGEVLSCLFEGGSVTIGPDGNLVMISAELIEQLRCSSD